MLRAINPAGNQEFSIVAVNTVVDDFLAHTPGAVAEEHLILHASVKRDLGVELAEVWRISFVNFNELLGIVHLFFEQDKVRHLAHEVVADGNLTQFWVLVELGVVHAERDHLLVVDNGDELRPGDKGLVMLDCKVVPFAGDKLGHQKPV